MDEWRALLDEQRSMDRNHPLLSMLSNYCILSLSVWSTHQPFSGHHDHFNVRPARPHVPHSVVSEEKPAEDKVCFVKLTRRSRTQTCVLCGSVAEWSKALDLGSSLCGGVGSNPTTASALSSSFNRCSNWLHIV